MFDKELLDKELAYILGDRRPAAGVVSPAGERDGASTEHELVGLALSGGGVRSATFALGVLQSLHRFGVFRHVDYLSTVSGGGYLGASISAQLREPIPEGGRPFPFAGAADGTEAPLVRHLRNSAEHLVARGPIDWFRGFAVVLRGVVLNFLTLFPLVAVWTLGVAAVHGGWLRDVSAGRARISLWALADLTRVAGLVGLAAVLIYPPLSRCYQRERALERARGQPGRCLLALRAWLRRPGEVDLDLRDRVERIYGWLLLAGLAAIAMDLQPLLIYGFHRLRQGASGGLLQTAAGLGGLLSLLAPLLAGRALRARRGLARRAALVAAGLLGPLLPILIYLNLIEAFIYGPWGWGAAAAMAALAAGMVVFTDRSVDINESSLHSYYRDRLTRTYLARVEDGAVRAEEDVPLSALSQRGSGAPYHLINATLNLQGSRDPALRGRQGDFFLFSRYAVGSERTGWAPTERMERRDPSLSLGSAMAIAAATAAPNMGSLTIRPLTFLMTLLDVRMGYWLPHPSRRTEPLYWRAGRLLLRELLGWLDDRGDRINITDGGHLENLGVYALLQRRCRFVIAVDAGADPEHSFGALAALIRYARLDLGVEIDIAMDALRLDDSGRSRRHCAMGVIRYPPRDGEPPELGYLLYLKSSLTGDEELLLKSYRDAHPDFPHESTADQFFDEAQFEAYRALGEHVAAGLFRSEVAEAQEISPGAFRRWFHTLGDRLAPVAADGGRDRSELGEAPGGTREHGPPQSFPDRRARADWSGSWCEVRPAELDGEQLRELEPFRGELDVAKGWPAAARWSRLLRSEDGRDCALLLKFPPRGDARRPTWALGGLRVSGGNRGRLQTALVALHR